MSFGLLLQIVGAFSPILLVALGAVLKRQLDAAQKAKTEAEARVALALEQKTHKESEGLVIDNAKNLIEQFREYQNEKDKYAAERLAVAESRSSSVESRMNRMEESFSRLRAVLATHGVWDAQALIDLRQMHSEYPGPPPLPQSLNEDLRGHNDS